MAPDVPTHRCPCLQSNPVGRHAYPSFTVRTQGPPRLGNSAAQLRATSLAWGLSCQFPGGYALCTPGTMVTILPQQPSTVPSGPQAVWLLQLPQSPPLAPNHPISIQTAPETTPADSRSSSSSHQVFCSPFTAKFLKQLSFLPVTTFFPIPP